LVLVQDDIDKAILTELGQFHRAEVYFFSISVTLRVTKPVTVTVTLNVTEKRNGHPRQYSRGRLHRNP